MLSNASNLLNLLPGDCYITTRSDIKCKYKLSVTQLKECKTVCAKAKLAASSYILQHVVMPCYGVNQIH